MNEIGRNIRSYREKFGLSQIDLASYIGKTPASISQYEKGTATPSLKTLQDIATTFGIDASNLIGTRKKTRLSTTESELMALISQLDERDKRVLIASAKAMLGEERPD